MLSACHWIYVTTDVVAACQQRSRVSNHDPPTSYIILRPTSSAPLILIYLTTSLPFLTTHHRASSFPSPPMNPFLTLHLLTFPAHHQGGSVFARGSSGLPGGAYPFRPLLRQDLVMKEKPCVVWLRCWRVLRRAGCVAASEMMPNKPCCAKRSGTILRDLDRGLSTLGSVPVRFLSGGAWMFARQRFQPRGIKMLSIVSQAEA